MLPLVQRTGMRGFAAQQLWPAALLAVRAVGSETDTPMGEGAPALVPGSAQLHTRRAGLPPPRQLTPIRALLLAALPFSSTVLLRVCCYNESCHCLPLVCRHSISRKAAFFTSMPFLRRMRMYTNTIARGTCIMYAADWTVSVGYATVDAVREEKHVEEEAAVVREDAVQAAGAAAAAGGAAGVRPVGAPARRAPGRLRRWAARVARLTAKSLLTWGLASGVAALVAVAAGACGRRPEHLGGWAHVAHFLADLILANLLFVLLDGDAASVLALLPPWLGGSGGGGHGGQEAGGGAAALDVQPEAHVHWEGAGGQPQPM